MKHYIQLYLSKKKIFIVLIVFFLIMISLHMTFQESVYHQMNHQLYSSGGLEFFYYLHSVGQNPYHFICLLLLLPNLVSADYLHDTQKHISYMIETRVTPKTFYRQTFLLNIFATMVAVLIIEILVLIIIHVFYFPITFNNTVYPPLYHATTQLLCSHEIINLILFILMTALGYSLVSALIMTLGTWVHNIYVYRCLGVIVGIALVLLPALLQVYIPIDNLAFIIQIQNLIGLGIEGVRENPLGMSYIMLYITCASLYSIVIVSLSAIQIKRRVRYD